MTDVTVSYQLPSGLRLSILLKRFLLFLTMRTSLYAVLRKIDLLQPSSKLQGSLLLEYCIQSRTVEEETSKNECEY